MMEVRALAVSGPEHETSCWRVNSSQVGTMNHGLFCLLVQCVAPDLAQSTCSVKLLLNEKI